MQQQLLPLLKISIKQDQKWEVNYKTY